MDEHIMVLSTVPSREEGLRIAEHLIDNRLAACVSLTSPILSLYRWKGKVNRDEEFILFIKTRGSLYKKLEGEIVKLHPYDTPEVISIPIQEGWEKYLQWLQEETEEG